MNLFYISRKNFRNEFFKKSLNIVLIAFGITIINTLLLVNHQLEQRLERQSGRVDLVVGAKGSPMQLILSSVYFIDFPTGNIFLKDVKDLKQHPYVEMAAPLSLGDSYSGYRIAGTNESFMQMYELELREGRVFKEEFEAIAGAEVAANLNLKIGSKFYSEHGLSEGGDHHDHPLTIVGILKKSGTAADNILLTDLETVWHAHGEEEDHEDEKQITALLIRYRTPLAFAVLPAQINAVAGLQTASPAMETARVFTLLNTGFDVIYGFGILILLLAAFSIFVVLYSSLSERKKDLALIRAMGGGKGKIFLLLLTEGLLLTLYGTLTGLIASHLLLEYSHLVLPAATAADLKGWIFIKEELYLLAFGLFTGISGALIPALAAYKNDISKVLAKN
jgi:putative ABC transport system permease protein